MRCASSQAAGNIVNNINPLKIAALIFSKSIGNNRGVALLVTLGVIAVIIAAAMHINSQAYLTASIAATARDRLDAYEKAASGIHAAMALLLKDKDDSKADSLQEDWADSDTLQAIVEEIGFDGETLILKISDELAKIQINSLVKFPEGREFQEAQRLLWDRFANRLMLLFEENTDTDAVTIIHSIKDWLDSGDDDAITGLSGAESSHYQDLDPPYECKNGPFTHLGEVALVNGITPEIFHGFGETFGMSNYITVHGISETEDNKFTYDGKININTAPLPVIAALLPSDAEGFAQALIDFREEKSEDNYVNELSNINWYKNVPGFSSIEIKPELIKVSTDVFRIQATAAVNDVKLTIEAVVQRLQDKKSKKWQCKILNWHTE